MQQGQRTLSISAKAARRCALRSTAPAGVALPWSLSSAASLSKASDMLGRRRVSGGRKRDGVVEEEERPKNNKMELRGCVELVLTERASARRAPAAHVRAKVAPVISLQVNSGLPPTKSVFLGSPLWFWSPSLLTHAGIDPTTCRRRDATSPSRRRPANVLSDR